MCTYIKLPWVKSPSDCGYIYGNYSVVSMYYYTEQIATVQLQAWALCWAVLRYSKPGLIHLYNKGLSLREGYYMIALT